VSVFEAVSPSVANIQTSIVRKFAGRKIDEYPSGAGSGFVWDDKHIVTNYHVVAGAPQGRPGRGQSDDGTALRGRKIKVSLPQLGDEQVEAEVIGYEADKDIAVLRVIDPDNKLTLTPLEKGSSAALKVGQNVLAIGNPFGLDSTLTTGIVSALGRDITGAGGRPIKDCVQTDAAINPGNSGGPLLDSRGRLIGVNTMIFAPGGLGANVGIGFAIPVDTVTRVVNQILTFGPNSKPTLGISVLPDSDRRQLSRMMRRPLEGAMVAEVVPGSPADVELQLKPIERRHGGVLLGDLITEVDGKTVTCNEDVLCAVEEAPPGQEISLRVMRRCDPDREEALQVTPVQRKALAESR